MVTPLGRHIVVQLIDMLMPPSHIIAASDAPVVRWADVTAVGSGCRDIRTGMKVLVSTNQGIAVGGDETLDDLAH